jgi:hypothetical protein
MEEVSVKFQWGRDEFVDFMRRRQYQIPARIFGFIGIAVIVVLATVNGISKVEGIFVVAVLIYGLIFSWYFPAFLWKKLSGIKDPISYVVSSEGVKITSSARITTKSWSELKRSSEIEGYYLLMKNRFTFSLAIPKRALASTSDEARLKVLLSHHTRAKLDQGTAPEAF